MSTIMDLLANLLNPNPGQNRLVAPNANGPNYLTQTGLSPDQLARFHQMSGVAQPVSARQAIEAMPRQVTDSIMQLPQAAPQGGSMPQQAPQPDQTQTASVAPPQPSGGGLLSRLFGGGQSDGENQTIQWLQQQGMDPGTATMMAKSKPILQAYLLKRSQGVDPTDALQAEKLGLEIDRMKHPQRETVTIDGKLVDKNSGELIKDYSTPPPKVRDLTPEEVKTRGYPAGSYQVDEKGNVSTVGGAREQDPTFGRELDVRSKYDADPNTLTYKKVRDSYERVRSAVAAGTGVDDIGVVFGYMKMLDPGSNVMEGERTTAQEAGGKLASYVNTYNRLVDGESLTPEVRQQFLKSAERLYKESASNLADTNTRYENIAKGWQLDPARIVQTPEQYEPLAPPGGNVPPPALPPEGPPPPAAPLPPARRALDEAAGVPPVRRRSWQELVAPGRR